MLMSRQKRKRMVMRRERECRRFHFSCFYGCRCWCLGELRRRQRDLGGVLMMPQWADAAHAYLGRADFKLSSRVCAVGSGQGTCYHLFHLGPLRYYQHQLQYHQLLLQLRYHLRLLQYHLYWIFLFKQVLFCPALVGQIAAGMRTAPAPKIFTKMDVKTGMVIFCYVCNWFYVDCTLTLSPFHRLLIDTKQVI